MTKTCKECGKPFITKNGALYCSDECRTVAKKRHDREYRKIHKEYLNLYHRNMQYRKKGEEIVTEEELQKIKNRVECESAHDGCFSCSTEDGECLFEF